MGFPGCTVVKNLSANAGDTGDAGFILVWGRSPEVENGNALQYSCLENSMGREVWQATVHGISQARILQWVAISCCRGSSRPRD